MSEILAVTHNLSKKFKVYGNPWLRAVEWLSGGRLRRHQEFWALRDITFEVREGECVGVIGPNGAGKSTLLKILTGALSPSSGEYRIHGTILSLLELGTGFNPELTGRQNLFNNAGLLGFPENYLNEMLREIEEFADIGEFFDRPLKTYSTGMTVRLAFSMFVCMRPRVLIVDEALSVGDIFFQQKCHQRMEELQRQGTSIILVSHDMMAIEKYSTRVMLLRSGECLFYGQPNEAVHRYYDLVHGFRRRPIPAPKELDPPVVSAKGEIGDWPPEQAFITVSEEKGIGSTGIARCTRVALCDDGGKPCWTFEVGMSAHFFFEVELLEEIEVPIGGVVLVNAMNLVICSKGSLHYHIEAPMRVAAGQRVRFRQRMDLNVAVGEYTFLVAFASMHAADYQSADRMDPALLHARINPIYRVKADRMIRVKERSKGIRIPFYGYVDLGGDSVCAVVDGAISDRGSG